MRSGYVFARPPLALRTVGTGGSASRGAWPTPQAHDTESPKSAAQIAAMRAIGPGVANLNEAVLKWPTPKAKTGGANSKRGERGAGGPDLQETARTWPTPACRDDKGANASDTHSTDQLPNVAVRWPTPSAMDSIGSRNATSTRPKGSAHHDGTTLTDAALTFPCSPQDPASGPMAEAVGCSLSIETLPDGSRCLRKGPTSRRRLNPAFVEWLMGWPIGWCDYAALETESWFSKVRSLYDCFAEGPE